MCGGVFCEDSVGTGGFVCSRTCAFMHDRVSSAGADAVHVAAGGGMRHGRVGALAGEPVRCAGGTFGGDQPVYGDGGRLSGSSRRGNGHCAAITDVGDVESVSCFHFPAFHKNNGYII